MNLDTIAGWLIALVAVCMFTLHIVTDPKKPHWITLPPLVRWGFLGSGFTSLLWASNFNAIELMPGVPGHINEFGLMALTWIAYTLFVFTTFVVSKVLKEHGWDRIAYAEQVQHDHPDYVPVMTPTQSIIETIRRGGGTAAGPKAPPRDLNAPPPS